MTTTPQVQIDGTSNLTLGTTAGGDLAGAYPNPTVARVHGVTVTNTPTAGQVLVATSPTTAAWQTLHVIPGQ